MTRRALVGFPATARQDYGLGWEVWALLAFATLGPLVLTNVLWFRTLHRIGASRATLVANLQPFVAAIVALTEWGDRWAAPQGHPVRYEHDDCGGRIHQHLRCEACDAAPTPAHVGVQPGPARVALGQVMMSVTDELSAPDDRTSVRGISSFQSVLVFTASASIISTACTWRGKRARA